MVGLFGSFWAHLAAGHSYCLWRDATGHGSGLLWCDGHGSRYGFRTQTADAGQGHYYTGHDFSRYAGHFNMRNLLLRSGMELN